MRWYILLVFINVIAKDVFGEEKSKRSLRSTRSLLSNKNIYKLDHFIELVEKIERHPSMKDKNSLKEIANYVRFGYSNQKWNKLLGTSQALPEGILSTDEKRVLQGMINHGFSGRQEEGVVNTPYGDVAMGSVIAGICAGMNRNKDLVLQEIYGLSSKHIDNLYAATVAGDIAQAVLMNAADSKLPWLGHGGTWSPNTQCPEAYTLSDHSSPLVLTDAKVLGGMDGFLLGLKVHEWTSVTYVRLGQLLRMYYRDGVVYNKNYAACRRFDTFDEVVEKKKIIDQIVLSMYAVKKVWHKGVDFSGVQTSAIPKLGQSANLLLNHLNSLGKNRTACPTFSKEACNLPANLVFVMDESGSIGSRNYVIEKAFVKNITDAFDITPYETQVAVIEYSSFAQVTIQLNEFASKSRLKCAVDRLRYYSGGHTYTGRAIKVARDVLQKARSEAGKNINSLVQILVLLTDGKSSDREDLRTVVTSLKRNMTDLTIVSVGIGNYDESELQLIATDPVKHVFTATDFSKLVNLVKSLRSRTCKSSKKLKPTTIAEQQGEDGKKKETKVSGYVSPGTARYFTLPKETLFKTENISIEIKPTYGTVTLYLSRTNDSPGPDDYDFKLEVGTNDDASISRKKRSTDAAQLGNRKFLQLFNLCKGYNETTCPPLYFSVVGKNSSQSCSDLDCSVPTQIKFELKTVQIIPKKENVCHFELEANKIHKAKDISIKMSATNDTISYYISRVFENPDSYNNSYKIKQVAAGRTKLITIPAPCKEYDNAACPPIYFFFRGAELMCSCTGRNCTLPNQVDIKVNLEDKDEDHEVKVEPKVCYHQLDPENLFHHKMVEIKASPVNGTITLYTSRVNKHPDQSNHSGKIDGIAVGQTNSLNISQPCKGFDRSSCPPLYLTFIGNQLKCNCTGKAGDERCSLPDDVSVIFMKKASPSSALTLHNSVCLIIIALVFSLLFE